MSLNIPVKIGKTKAFIRSDPKNYMICVDRTSVNGKTGETETSTEFLGFYMNLTSLLNALIKMKIRASTARTLEELRQEIVKAKESVLWAYDETINAEIAEMETENE